MNLGDALRTKLIAAGAVLGIVLLGLPGCSHGPDPQTVKMNTVLANLKLATISNFACDYTYEPGLINPDGNPHQRSIALSGDDHREEAIARLEHAGFVLTDDLGGHARFKGPNGMQAGVTPSDPDRAGTDIRYDSKYTCSVPTNGMTEVTLTLK